MRALVVLLVVVASPAVGAQALSQRGFGEGAGQWFPLQAPGDPTRFIGDARARSEVFYKPAPWIQFAAGVDLRANSHGQVEDSWRLDYSDRGVLRPRLSIRRLSATLTRGRVTVDAGKQFIRWGKTDVVTPSDRFAPRDFMNVIDAEFLAITAVRAVAQIGDDTVEGVWAPRLTPSRTPLFGQRWSGVPANPTLIAVVDGGSVVPSGQELGARWSHIGQRLEYSLSYFDGFNHLPEILSTFVPAPPAVALTRVYPAIRTYAADVAVPTAWFTVKAETAYFRSSPRSAGAEATDDYLLYVIQLERQTGEWVFIGGYAGEAVTDSRSAVVFAPDRGLSRAIVWRASYTLGPTRSLAFEGAARQNGAGVYARGEYSQAYGQHWRATVSGVAIGGRADDFLGQYRRNSHATLTVRFSF